MKNNQKTHVKICKDRDNFKFTIPLRLIRALNAKTNDYIKIIFTDFGCETVIKIPNKSKSRKYLQIKLNIPFELIDTINPKDGDLLNLEIELIENLRSNNLLNKGYLDILSAIPLTIENKNILIETLEEDVLKIWYFNKTKPKPLIIKRFIKIDRNLGEFFGLMQAESGKKGNKFSFTSILLSEIKQFRDYLSHFKTNKSWRYTLHYSSKINDIKDEINRLKDYLNLENNKIFLAKNKCIKHTAYVIDVTSVVLKTIMIHLLKTLRSYIADTEELTDELNRFAIGFIIKDLIGDGTVIINNSNKGLQVNISEPDLDTQRDIINILKKFNIDSYSQGIKIQLSTDFKSCLWLFENGAFKGHNYNRSKLLYYILHNYYFTCLYQRLNLIKRSIPIKDFETLSNLSYKSAAKYLSDNSKRGFISIDSVRPTLYSLSKNGEKYIQLIEEAKKEYCELSLNHPYWKQPRYFSPYSCLI
jgi:predicted transcriptional regulator